MKKMTINGAGLILGLGMLVPQVRANSVVLTQDAYSYDVGGEFNAVTSPDNFLPYYSPLAVVGNGFQTFCIETAVEFSPGNTYSYTLSSSDSQGRDLTQGAAFLYDEFGHGVLPNYDYADAGARQSDAGALQAAIWWFQGEQTWAGYPSPTDNIYYEFAINTLGLVQADSANNGRFRGGCPATMEWRQRRPKPTGVGPRSWRDAAATGRELVRIGGDEAPAQGLPG